MVSSIYTYARYLRPLHHFTLGNTKVRKMKSKLACLLACANNCCNVHIPLKYNSSLRGLVLPYKILKHSILTCS